ncbi:glycosyltransferase family A protein [Formosa sp. 3Alg 14/1]|uniref:glycosyltransferase family A protein n=1 Tax=Formosa sp. 3Alg 14/1 TaxID=3382190 RepID=UPI0039BE54F5
MSLPAIVIPTFNRPKSLNRLLFSIKQAEFNEFPPIVFSIDGGGSKEIVTIAEQFSWEGEKEIILHDENLGLKSHILKCGDLTERYGAIVLLEDDLFVSKYFYNYTHEALSFYQDDNDIAGISLYQYEYLENVDLPFKALVDGYDTYFIQMASSWGQAWSKEQWIGFKSWFKENSVWDNSDKRLPKDVLAWPETSWKKYYIKYLVDTNRYFVYPRISLTTNFGDAGTNNGYKNSLHQVNILIGAKTWTFSKLNQGIKYDVHFELDGDMFKENLECFSSDESLEMVPFELNKITGLLHAKNYELAKLKIKEQKFDYKLLFNLSDSTISKIQNELPSLKIQIKNQLIYTLLKKLKN